MKKFSLTLLFCLSISISVIAQEPPNDDWVRLETENKEFSVEIPEDFSVVRDERSLIKQTPGDPKSKIIYENHLSVSAYSKGATVFFDTYDSIDSLKGLSLFIDRKVESKDAVRKFEFGGFKVYEVIRSGTIEKHYFYVASSVRTYIVGYSSRGKENATAKRFLDTLRLNGRSLSGMSLNSIPPKKTLSIEGLLETEVEVEYNLKPKEVKSSFITPVSQPIADTEDNKGIVIFQRPFAAYTEDARKARVQGQISLIATFKANGKIGKIVVTKTLDHGMVDQVIKAVRGIRFLPSVRDGVEIDTEKSLIYHFSLY